MLWGALGAPLGRPWGVLGRPWAVPVPSVSALGRPKDASERLWARQSAPERKQGVLDLGPGLPSPLEPL